MKLLKNKMLIALGCFLVVPFLLGLSLALADIDPSDHGQTQLAELD